MRGSLIFGVVFLLFSIIIIPISANSIERSDILSYDGKTIRSYRDNICFDPNKQNTLKNLENIGQPYEKLIQTVNHNNVNNFKENNWTFNPTDDTFIVEDYPNDVKGAQNKMIVSALNQQYNDRDVLIKFDISSIPSNIVVFAKLYLYFYHMENNPSGREYSIYRITNNWGNKL